MVIKTKPYPSHALKVRLAIIMYRRYLQSCSESSMNSDASIDQMVSSVPKDSSQQDGFVAVHFSPSSNFPGPHNIVGEAQMKAARSLSCNNIPTCADESNNSFTFDPGGPSRTLTPKSSLIKQSDLQEILEIEEVQDRHEALGNAIWENAGFEPSPPDVYPRLNPEPETIVRPPLSVWTVGGSFEKDELIMIKPIRDHTNGRIPAPSPLKFAKASRSAIIRVLPAVASPDCDAVNNNLDKLTTLTNGVASSENLTNGFHKSIMPAATTPKNSMPWNNNSSQNKGQKGWNVFNPVCCGLTRTTYSGR